MNFAECLHAQTDILRIKGACFQRGFYCANHLKAKARQLSVGPTSTNQPKLLSTLCWQNNNAHFRLAVKSMKWTWWSIILTSKLRKGLWLGQFEARVHTLGVISQSAHDNYILYTAYKVQVTQDPAKQKNLFLPFSIITTHL